MENVLLTIRRSLVSVRLRSTVEAIVSSLFSGKLILVVERAEPLRLVAILLDCIHRLISHARLLLAGSRSNVDCLPVKIWQLLLVLVYRGVRLAIALNQSRKTLCSSDWRLHSRDV